MKKKSQKKLVFVVLGSIIVFALLLFLIPGIRHRMMWQWEISRTYLTGVLNPVEAVPTARPEPEKPQQPTLEFTEVPPPTITPVISPTAIVEKTALPTPTLTPLPAQVLLPSPAYELQDINNCGPATLAMYLRFYGWEGDQFTISDVIKPIPQDRNVNVEELDYFVKNYTGWLRTIYRVGGDLSLIKELIAAGIPVMIEETFRFSENYWPNDDRWAGHYLLINGYDDQRQAFLTQDSFHGADVWVSYEETDRNWQSFNRVYTIIYLPEQEESLKSILGEDWDAEKNRENALESAVRDTETDPGNVFAWFNKGSNLVYFGRYEEGAIAFDKAREIGWPQRMLRYQFSPFMAYFHGLRNDDLLVLVDYALERTPNSEEALLWQGWGLYRAGDSQGAVQAFQKALEARPDYPDAIYALNFLASN